jgi:hypothetical protein
MAAFTMLKKAGKGEAETSYHVRNYAGTPNVFKKGKAVMVVRAFDPFYNVFLQGWKSDLQRMNPKSKSGWWFKWAMTDGALAVFTALSAAGALTAALKEIFGAASEYDRSTKNLIPVGLVGGGEFGYKAAFLTIPRAEDSRLLSGLLYKAIYAAASENPGEWGSILSFGADQFPSANPAITVPMRWGQALSGGDPKDSLRGRSIIPYQERTAGGTAIIEPMVLWTLQESGMGNFLSWNPRANTVTEFALSATPGLNRILKITDTGLREQQAKNIQAEKQAYAEQALKLPDVVRSLKAEYNYLENLKDHRTSAQERRFGDLKAWHDLVYNPSVETIRTMVEEKQEGAAGREREALGRASSGYKRR